MTACTSTLNGSRTCAMPTNAHAGLRMSVKRQCHGYGDRNWIVRFHRGEWIWRVYSHQGGKLRYTNRGPWLVIAKTGPVVYKIQHHPQAEPDILHVDKLMPYYLDFREELQSWIEIDHPTQYRDRGPTSSSDPIEGHSRHTSTSIRAHSWFRNQRTISRFASPWAWSWWETWIQNPIVHGDEGSIPSVRYQPGFWPDRWSRSVGRTKATLESEVAPAPVSEITPDLLLFNQTISEGSDRFPEVETTSACGNPDAETPETLLGNRSPIPSPRRGTRPCKQPERYIPVRRLQVLPID